MSAGDYHFDRVTADQLARAMSGDVRKVPSALKVAEAKAIIGHLEQAVTMTRPFWVWHFNWGKFGDPKAMSCTEIECTPLWFWSITGESKP